jgi:hypothetical protein
MSRVELTPPSSSSSSDSKDAQCALADILSLTNPAEQRSHLTLFMTAILEQPQPLSIPQALGNDLVRALLSLPDSGADLVSLALATLSAIQRSYRIQFDHPYLPNPADIFSLLTLAARYRIANSVFLTDLFSLSSFVERMIEADGLIEIFRTIVLSNPSRDLRNLELALFETASFIPSNAPGLLSFLSRFANFDQTLLSTPDQIAASARYFLSYYALCKRLGLGDSFDRLAFDDCAFSRFISVVSALPSNICRDYLNVVIDRPDDQNRRPNTIFLEALYPACQSTASLRSGVFELLLHHYEVNRETTQRINSVFPLRSWFSECKIPFSLAITLLPRLQASSECFVWDLLECVFDAVREEPPDEPESYFWFLNVIRNELVGERCTLANLSDTRFIHAAQ